MRSVKYTNSNGDVLNLGPGTGYIIESIEGIDIPKVNIQSQIAPYQDGASYIDALLAPRDIRIIGRITQRSLSDVYTARNSFMAILSPKMGEGVFEFTSPLGIKALNVIPESILFANKLSTEPFQKFALSFKALNPFWEDQNNSEYELNLTTNLLTFPMQFPMAFSSRPNTSNTIDINNIGHVEAPILITFTGPSLNPKITNQTTGEYIKVNVDLLAGDQLIINTAVNKKSIIHSPLGGNQSNGMALLDLDSTFFQLALGINQISFTDDTSATTSSALLTYRNRFLGV